MGHLFWFNVLGFELGFLISERLYPVVSEEAPQGVPDRGLVFHVDSHFDQLVQGIHVGLGQG